MNNLTMMFAFAQDKVANLTVFNQDTPTYSTEVTSQDCYQGSASKAHQFAVQQLQSLGFTLIRDVNAPEGEFIASKNFTQEAGGQLVAMSLELLTKIFPKDLTLAQEVSLLKSNNPEFFLEDLSLVREIF